MAMAFVIETNTVVLRWFFLFFMGFMTFRFFAGLASGRLTVALLAGGVVGAYYTIGLQAAVAGLVAVWFILFFKHHNAVLEFLGNISYSLYLIHVPIGGRVINLGSRYAVSEIAQVGVVLFATATSILSAWLLYRFVEKPAQEWAAAIRYK